MKTAENKTLTPITKGMASNYWHTVAPEGSFSYLENMNCDTMGALTSRPNLYFCATDSTISSGIFSANFGSSLYFYVKVGSALKKFDASAPGAVSATIAAVFVNTNVVVRADQVQGAVFMASSGTAIKCIDVTDVVTTPALGIMGTAACDLINTGFSGRVWAASSGLFNASDTGKLYYSDVLTAAPASVTGSGAFLNIPTKGFPLTALVEADNVLYVFTNSSIFRVYNTQSNDNSPFSNVGAVRQEAVVKGPNSVFFMHNSGVYELRGGQVTKISQDIDNIIQKLRTTIANGQLNVYGWSTGDSVYFSVDLGPQYLTGNYVDRTYVLKYNFIYKTWSTNSYKDVQINGAASKSYPTANNDNSYDSVPSVFIAANYLNQDGTASALYVYGLEILTRYVGEKPFANGASLGEPLGDWCNSNVDSTSPPTVSSTIRPIFCTAETQWLTNFSSGQVGIGEVEIKQATGIAIPSENAENFKVFYQIDNDETRKTNRENAKWTEIGSLKDSYMTFFKDWKSEDFYRIKFRFAGATLGKPVKIGMPTILTVQSYGYGNN